VRYTIIWIPPAEQALAAVWLAAADRNAVTWAVTAIDLALAHSPNTSGTVLFDTVRAFEHPPLGVEFEVIDDDSQVFILSVWDVYRGRPNVTGN
jgi:hypothetical protein